MMTMSGIRRRWLLARMATVAILAGALGGCQAPASSVDPNAPDTPEAAGASAATVEPPASLAGTWRLARIERYDQAGAPLSELMHPTIGLAERLGFLMSDGERLGLVVQEEAGASSAPDGRPPDEALAAVERYTAYFGPYTRNDAEGYVSQQIVGGLNPRLIGSRLEPLYELDGNQLVLVPSLQCPDSYATERGCAYGTTGVQLRNVWKKLQPSPGVGAEARRFLGFWEIDRIERRTLDGAELPTEQFAAGYLSYMPSGYMAVHLMRPDRRPYTGPRPTALEAHASMRSYASYFGPFTVDVDEGVVVHHRAGHLDPDSIGVDAPRAFEFRDGQLILRPPVSTVDAREVQTSVYWNRLSTLDPDAGQD